MDTKKVFTRNWFCWKQVLVVIIMNFVADDSSQLALKNFVRWTARTKFFSIHIRISGKYTHLWLEHVHGPADVGVHPVSLHAHEDPLLESLDPGVKILPKIQRKERHFCVEDSRENDKFGNLSSGRNLDWQILKLFLLFSAQNAKLSIGIKFFFLPRCPPAWLRELR